MSRNRTGRSPVNRNATLVGVAALTTLALAGCSSGSSGSAVPGAPAAHTAAAATGAATVDQRVAAAAPAADALMPSGSTAAKIKAKGTLTVGGTQTAALFSLLNPTTAKIDGFDAAMSRLLAKYIIGKDSTKLTNVTAQTREALLKNHSVDTVFATYTITPEREQVVAFAGPYSTTTGPGAIRRRIMMTRRHRSPGWLPTVRIQSPTAAPSTSRRSTTPRSIPCPRRGSLCPMPISLSRGWPSATSIRHR